jgi:hypothetical protein
VLIALLIRISDDAEGAEVPADEPTTVIALR